VADLDAILDDAPHVDLYSELAARDFQLIVDAGLRDMERAAALFAAGVNSVVAGLETIPGPQLLRDLCVEFGPDRVLFSLDLKYGEPLFAPDAVFDSTAPLGIAAVAQDAGIRRMIVLDLAAVGTGAGLSTLPLCREIRHRFPGVQIVTGGGIRNANDLRELNRAGLDGVLIATALHNGSITRNDLSSA
jgi:phosphoribosylformimino-5-aminoimidazole carboxamide ribotide isomerase